MPDINITGPFFGVNKALDPRQLGPLEAQDALNLLLSYGTVRKRPGFTERWDFSADGAILGGYDYLKVDTGDGSVDIIHLVKAGSKLYRGEDWEAQAYGISLSSTELADFTTMNNRCYFVESTVLKVTDGTDIHDAQIARPSAPTAALDATSGNLDGKYDYKYTYYSSTWGQESPASDASSVVECDGEQVDLSGMTASSDSRVDKKRIYRRKVSAAEVTWKFVAEIANATTTYDDNTLDNDVDDLTISPLSYSDTLPEFRFLAQQAGVLFLSGCDKYPTRLYYTRAGRPWTVDQYLEVGSGSDTDAVTGLAAFQGVVVVFKERSIWVLSGNSADTFYLRKITPEVGCRSHHSIINVGDVLLFLGHDGFWAFDGTNANPISGAEAQDPIRPDVVNRNHSRDRYCVGAYEPRFSMVLWSYSGPDSPTNDKIYVYFYEHSKKIGAPSWVPWYVEGGLSWIGRITDPTTRERVLYLGRNSGSFGYLFGNADDTEPFNYYWKTGEFDGLDASRFKIWKEFAAEFEQTSESSEVTVKYYLDNGTSNTLRTHDQTSPVCRARLGRSSRFLTFEFNGTSDQPAELMGWSLDYERAGRA